jgi:pimeloyl-ACP methyl ester carboxylesterase
MASVDVRGGAIHYAERNAGRADGLVLLHAFPVHGGMWREVMEGVPATWRGIVQDFRGFGASTVAGGSGGAGEAGAFTIEDLAEDVRGVVEQLGLGRVVVAGLSMGGYVALAFARKYPELLRGLILLDTKAGADTAEGKANRDRMIAIAREKGAGPIAQAMLGKMIPAETAAHRPHLAQELVEMMEGTRAETIAAALSAMRDRPDRTEELAAITVPTLVGVGDQDEITPVEVAREMAAKIPGARLKVFTGSGHLSAMEQPSQVAAAVTEFLARI